MKIVQISDTHISHLGGPTRENLLKVIDYINTEIKPDLVVHSGDIVILDPDKTEDRLAAKELLDGISAPVRYIPGNHDVGETWPKPWADLHATEDRVEAHREVFGDDFWVENFGDNSIIALDSEILAAEFPLAQEQWAWLETVPAIVGDRPAFVFSHKPVFDPFPGVDQAEHQMSIPPEAKERLIKILKDVDVRVFASGHLHRYAIEQEGDAWVVSAPATGFTAGGPTTMPGLVQLGIVEYDVEPDGTVTPAYVSIRGLDTDVANNKVLGQAFADLGQAWTDVNPAAESDSESES